MDLVPCTFVFRRQIFFSYKLRWRVARPNAGTSLGRAEVHLVAGRSTET